MARELAALVVDVGREVAALAVPGEGELVVALDAEPQGVLVTQRDGLGEGHLEDAGIDEVAAGAEELDAGLALADGLYAGGQGVLACSEVDDVEDQLVRADQLPVREVHDAVAPSCDVEGRTSNVGGVEPVALGRREVDSDVEVVFEGDVTGQAGGEAEDDHVERLRMTTRPAMASRAEAPRPVALQPGVFVLWTAPSLLWKSKPTWCLSKEAMAWLSTPFSSW